MPSNQFSNHRLVHDFIVAFKKLTEDREPVIQELEDFCQGYRDGKAEVWMEMLAIDVEKVIGETAGATLAATMTDMHIKPGHFCKGRS